MKGIALNRKLEKKNLKNSILKEKDWKKKIKREILEEKDEVVLYSGEWIVRTKKRGIEITWQEESKTDETGDANDAN